jgi:hypothetical protein
MQIIKKGELTILIPENGYELISKKTGIHSEKIYLSKFDSADNYIEVMKNDYMSGLEDLKEQKDAEINLLLETIDSLIMLLEPIFMAIPFAINEGPNPIEKLVDFYIAIIKRGIRNTDEIPLLLKDLVIEKLNK